jgi:hypothetical protein
MDETQELQASKRRRGRPKKGEEARVDQCTPQEVVDGLLRLWPDGADLDPASNVHSIVPARQHVLLPDYAQSKGLSDWPEDRLRLAGIVIGDGLTLPWSGKVYVNPPYARGANEAWASKIDASAAEGCEIVALVQWSHGSSWWRRLIARSTAQCHVDHRLQFLFDGEPMKNGANFDVAVLYYGAAVDAFADAFKPLGGIYTRIR